MSPEPATPLHALDPSSWLAAIVASSDDAIVGKRLDSTVVSWNAAAERMFGWTAAEIIGRSILVLFPPELRYQEKGIIERLVRGERIDHFETQRVHKNGTRLDVSISVSPILDAAGTIVGAAKIARNITDAKRMQNALRQMNLRLEQQAAALVTANEQLHAALGAARVARSAAEKASQAKSEFLATMSHELRTPLNAISGYADLMHAGIAGALPPEYSTYVDKIQRSQMHLQHLIASVLDFSNLGTGKLAIEVEPIGVADVLDRVAPLVASQAALHGLSLRFERPARSLCVTADRDRALQIVLNLLSNAIKFTPRGGAITVTTTQANGTVGIHVTDNGPGIAPRDHERVFEPFMQVDRSLTRKHDGVGLGLAISRDLARAMAGDVTLDSAIGAGATFTLTLPGADEMSSLPS